MTTQATSSRPDGSRADASAPDAEHAPPGTSQRQRQPWIAALMSLMLPGFGQLYCGMMSRAFWIFLAFLGSSTVGLLLVSLLVSGKGMLAALVGLMLLSFGIWFFSITDAWRQADYINNTAAAARLHPWQQAATYVGVFLLSTLMLLPALVTHIRTHYVQAFHIPSASMEPALLQGDFVFADMRYNCPGCRYRVSHDDVAIFINPNERNHFYVKRIVGLPGDNISINDGKPVMTGTSATTGTNSAVASNEATPAEAANSIVVPDGHVFVMGDNRDNSRDSRSFGPVPLADVKARVRQVWLSRGS